MVVMHSSDEMEQHKKSANFHRVNSLLTVQMTVDDLMPCLRRKYAKRSISVHKSKFGDWQNEGPREVKANKRCEKCSESDIASKLETLIEDLKDELKEELKALTSNNYGGKLKCQNSFNS